MFKRSAIAALLLLWSGMAIAQPVTTKPNVSNLVAQCLSNVPVVGSGAGASPICHASGALGVLAFTTPGTGVATALTNNLNATGGIVSPTPTRAGDVIYWSGSAWVTLAGNNSGSNCLGENSSGVPSWVTCSGGGSTGANPTATASDTAVNGVATTFMRSDGAPAVQKASNAQFGVMEGDGSTITCTTGVCSATTTAWGSFSPTLSCGTGSLTTASATGAFKQIGKTVFYRFVISITLNGSCAGSLRITLPVAPLSGVDMMTPVRDVGTSVVGAGRINSGLGNLLLINLYNGGYLGGDAASIVGTGVYEAN